MKPSAYISSFAVLAVYATLPGPFTNALNLAHSPAPKGSVVELSVYSTKYHNHKTRWGYRYDHYKGYTCASNNPAHKLKTIRFTWKGKTLDVFCNDTGGDKQLGYSRMDLSGAAMKFFVPKWNGSEKTAPLLKGATMEVLK